MSEEYNEGENEVREEGTGGGGAEVRLDDFVARLVADPNDPPDLLILSGFLGASSEEGHIRLYLDEELSRYVEVPQDSIRHTRELPPEESPLGGSLLWIDRKTEVLHGKAGTERQKATFLEGQIAQDFIGGAAGGGEGVARDAGDAEPPDLGGVGAQIPRTQLLGCQSQFGPCIPPTFAAPLCDTRTGIACTRFGPGCQKTVADPQCTRFGPQCGTQVGPRCPSQFFLCSDTRTDPACVVETAFGCPTEAGPACRSQFGPVCPSQIAICFDTKNPPCQVVTAFGCITRVGCVTRIPQCVTQFCTAFDPSCRTQNSPACPSRFIAACPSVVAICDQTRSGPGCEVGTVFGCTTQAGAQCPSQLFACPVTNFCEAATVASGCFETRVCGVSQFCGGGGGFDPGGGGGVQGFAARAISPQPNQPGGGAGASIPQTRLGCGPSQFVPCPSQWEPCVTQDITCQSQFVRCPTQDIRCPSVVVKCPSVLDDCPTRFNCPSQVQICPTQVHTGCPSTRADCPSVFIKQCPSAFDACPTRVGCESIATPCITKDAACESRFGSCQSQLDACPTRVGCESVASPCFSRVGACETMGACPSAADGCPSQRGCDSQAGCMDTQACGGFDPRGGFNRGGF